MKKTFKPALALLALVLATALLAGCSPTLPEGMEEETLTADAQGIIDMVNAQDYAGLAAACPGIDFTEEAWQEALEPYTTAWGAFERYGEAKLVTGDSDDFGELVAVYQETVYTEQKMVWMVSFTTEYECVGLRIAG